MKIRKVKWWELLILLIVALILFFPSQVIKLLTVESTEDMILSERGGKRKWWQSLIRIVASFTPLAVVVSIHDEFFPSGGGVLRTK